MAETSGLDGRDERPRWFGHAQRRHGHVDSRRLPLVIYPELQPLAAGEVQGVEEAGLVVVEAGGVGLVGDDTVDVDPDMVGVDVVQIPVVDGVQLDGEDVVAGFPWLALLKTPNHCVGRADEKSTLLAMKKAMP